MFDLLHCQVNENILLIQVNNAIILKTIKAKYNNDKIDQINC